MQRVQASVLASDGRTWKLVYNPGGASPAKFVLYTTQTDEEEILLHNAMVATAFVAALLDEGSVVKVEAWT